MKSLLFVVGTCTLANVFCGPTEALKSLLVTKVFGVVVMELSWLTGILHASLCVFWMGSKRLAQAEAGDTEDKKTVTI